MTAARTVPAGTPETNNCDEATVTLAFLVELNPERDAKLYCDALIVEEEEVTAVAFLTLMRANADPRELRTFTPKPGGPEFKERPNDVSAAHHSGIEIIKLVIQPLGSVW